MGVKASASFTFDESMQKYAHAHKWMTFLENPSNDESISVGGPAITFKDSPDPEANEVLIGGTPEETAQNFANFLTPGRAEQTFFVRSVSGASVEIYAKIPGNWANSIGITPNNPGKFYFDNNVPPLKYRFNNISPVDGIGPIGTIPSVSVSSDKSVIHIEGACSTPYFIVKIITPGQDPTAVGGVFNQAFPVSGGQVSIDIQGPGSGEGFISESVPLNETYRICTGEQPNVGGATYHIRGYDVFLTLERDPSPSSQFDNGVDGMAIIIAGEEYQLCEEMSQSLGADPVPNQIYIESIDDFAVALGNALSADASGLAYAFFSTGTEENELVEKKATAARSLEVQARLVGEQGDSIEVSVSGSGGSWATATLEGGEDGSQEAGDSDKRILQSTGGSITGFLDLASPEFTAIVDGEFGKTFRFFSDDLAADVRIGDRLVEGSEKYDVKGVMPNLSGPGRKLELTIVKAIDQ